MKTKIDQASSTDQMPKEVATALLLSGQSTSNRFRKVCNTAREKICEPVSRSTVLNVSAPKTPMQRFEQRLRKSNAKQLTTWLRRASRRGERLQDTLFDNQTRLAALPDAKNERFIALLERHLAEIDGIGQAIKSELDNRSTRGSIKL